MTPHLPLSGFQGNSLLCKHTYLLGPRKVIDFQLFNISLVVKMQVTISKFFTCLSWNWKFLFFV